MPLYDVLMPIDESEERAVAQAEVATGLPQASEEIRVHLLHVFDDRESADSTDVRQITGGNIARERLAEADVTIEPMTRHGEPAEEILRAADEINADLVVLGGRKRSPLGSLLFGSVSQAVTLDATRPVVVTGQAEQTEKPSHRCPTCGEEYYTDEGVEINTCRNCGGTRVEAA